MRLPAALIQERETGRLGDGRVGSDILDFRFLIPEWEIFAAKGRKENKRNLTGKKRGKAGKNGKVWEVEQWNIGIGFSPARVEKWLPSVADQCLLGFPAFPSVAEAYQAGVEFLRKAGNNEARNYLPEGRRFFLTQRP